MKKSTSAMILSAAGIVVAVMLAMINLYSIRPDDFGFAASLMQSISGSIGIAMASAILSAVLLLIAVLVFIFSAGVSRSEKINSSRKKTEEQLAYSEEEELWRKNAEQRKNEAQPQQPLTEDMLIAGGTATGFVQNPEQPHEQDNAVDGSNSKIEDTVVFTLDDIFSAAEQPEQQLSFEEAVLAAEDKTEIAQETETAAEESIGETATDIQTALQQADEVYDAAANEIQTAANETINETADNAANEMQAADNTAEQTEELGEAITEESETATQPVQQNEAVTAESIIDEIESIELSDSGKLIEMLNSGRWSSFTDRTDPGEDVESEKADEESAQAQAEEEIQPSAQNTDEQENESVTENIPSQAEQTPAIIAVEAETAEDTAEAESISAAEDGADKAANDTEPSEVQTSAEETDASQSSEVQPPDEKNIPVYTSPVEGDIEQAILSAQRFMSNFGDNAEDGNSDEITESLIYRLFTSKKN